jgi:[glutamine synthetase] adenylyltransferase / [glutamine synthetase]-adenylyl-L-tyrosine phosphorylase
MKPTLESLKQNIPEIKEELLEAHYNRLNVDYFRRFSEDHIKRHVLAISRLTSKHPVEIIIDRIKEDEIEITVLAFDYPGELSLITGVLAGSGFNVMSGDVYTYASSGEAGIKKGFRPGRYALSPGQEAFHRRKIIDFFSGSLANPLYFDEWPERFKKNLEEVVGLLETCNQESLQEARNRVNEMVVNHLSGIPPAELAAVLYPMEIAINNDGPLTRLKIISEDTPAFLYSLSNALSLHGIVIEHVSIRTIHGRVEDTIDLVDSQGRKIEDRETLDRIKLSVLLTKEFTYFLAKAPDPYTALSRFELLLNDILNKPAGEKWISFLTNPDNLQDFARLLGASDFLWEDFIRLQYESLLPLLRLEGKGQVLSKSGHAVRDRLNEALKDARSLDEKKRAINLFKDQENFLIDLDHILNKEPDIIFLSERLTDLAEAVVNASALAVYDDLTARYGRPTSVAGLTADYAMLGLGKLGGAALGYASDIELMFVYNDNGKTDGRVSIDNVEFFNLLAKGVNLLIESKREGIFQVDLRLRPHGESGPLATSLEGFCNYYGKDGQAHPYELLSLVRMRAVGGDEKLGKQLERIRDELVYFSDNVDIPEIRTLREKQLKEKSVPGKVNAKFSPGGLVDLEYGVQILQVIHGRDIAALRTPRIHEALKVLGDANLLSEADSLRLIDAYNFLRNLINGLRMLRGNAKDLFLPATGSNEFGHLARRMGYVRGGALDTAQQLYMDFETHTAMVRIFAERYFGRDALPAPDLGTIADVILSEQMPETLRNRILSQGGFNNPQRAYVNLLALAGEGYRREVFLRIALLAWDMLKRMPDPDMALNNWDRYMHILGNADFHFNLLLSQPMHLDILLSIFSGSQFLSDTLIRNPEFFDWLTIPEVLHRARKREDLEGELRDAARTSQDRDEWLNKLRRFRRRETLRIGVRDIFLKVALRSITQELTVLAEALTQVCLEECIKRISERITQRNSVVPDLRADRTGIELTDMGNHFCIMAFGKMGGNELNYSSDIDLLGMFDGNSCGNEDPKEILAKLMEEIVSDLSTYNEEGYVYRVDLRLRPFGSSGVLVNSLEGLMSYYENSASLWEIQAAIKLRPIAGDLRLGYSFMERMNKLLRRLRDRKEIVDSIEKMRNLAIETYAGPSTGVLDIKSGIGGIRDIEFMVQGLQLIHATEKRVAFEGNTMSAIENLCEAGIWPHDIAETMKQDYIFLRRTEHCLQLLEDRQVHALPGDTNELMALSKRMLGVEANMDLFMDQLNERLKRVRGFYERYLLEE